MSNNKPGIPRKSAGAGRASPAGGKKASQDEKRSLRERGSSVQKNRPRKQSGNTSDSFPSRDQPDLRSFSENVRTESELRRKRPARRSSQYIKALPPAKAPITPQRRKLKRLLFYAATIIVLVSVCCVLSLTVFFKIDSIEVKGETRYDSDKIISSSSIKLGDNLILCNTSPGEKNIRKEFPYIETVSINKKLFNKIEINVKEAVPASIIESSGKYILLSETGKIIDISSERQCSVPIVLGARLKTPELSSAIKYEDDNIEGYISEMIDCAEKYRIGKLETIDITNLSKIRLERSDGMRIILGSPEGIDYKLKTAKKILEKDAGKGNGGTLDVSLASSEGGKSYFTPNKPGSDSPQESKEASNASGQGSASDNSSKQESSQDSSESSSENSNIEAAENSSFDNDGGYDEGYDDGYYEGYNDGGYDEGYYGGYDEGYNNDGYDG